MIFYNNLGAKNFKLKYINYGRAMKGVVRKQIKKDDFQAYHL